MDNTATLGTLRDLVARLDEIRNVAQSLASINDSESNVQDITATVLVKLASDLNKTVSQTEHLRGKLLSNGARFF